MKADVLNESFLGAAAHGQHVETLPSLSQTFFFCHEDKVGGVDEPRLPNLSERAKSAVQIIKRFLLEGEVRLGLCL